MLISILECFNKSENFWNISSNWQVIAMHMSQNSISINDVSSSHGYTAGFIIWIIDQCSILFTDGMRWVSEKWNIHFTKTAQLSVFQCPLFMDKDWVNRSSNDLAANFLELFGMFRELNDLSWANKCEIAWIKEEDYILSSELLKGDLLEFLVPVSHTFEWRCWFSDSSFSWISTIACGSIMAVVQMFITTRAWVVGHTSIVVKGICVLIGNIWCRAVFCGLGATIIIIKLHDWWPRVIKVGFQSSNSWNLRSQHCFGGCT